MGFLFTVQRIRETVKQYEQARTEVETFCKKTGQAMSSCQKKNTDKIITGLVGSPAKSPATVLKKGLEGVKNTVQNLDWYKNFMREYQQVKDYDCERRYFRAIKNGAGKPVFSTCGHAVKAIKNFVDDKNFWKPSNPLWK